MATFSFEEVTGASPPKRKAVSKPSSKQAVSGTPSRFDSLHSSVPGLKVTSGDRTPEKNKKVGGKSNSYHLQTDMAQDVLPPSAEQAPAVRQWAASNGMKVIDEGDHWHLQPAKKSDGKVAAPAPELKPGEFSFEDAIAAATGVPTAKAATKPKTGEAPESGILDRVKDFAAEQFGPTATDPDGSAVPKFIREPVGKTAKKGFEFIAQRLKDKPNEFLGRKYRMVERAPEEIERMLEETTFGMKPGPLLGREEWKKKERERLRYEKVLDAEDGAEERDILARKAAREAPKGPEGFLANLENPAKLLTEDSLPANFIETYANLPDTVRKKFMEARQVTMQQRIVDNPDQFPDVAVQAAQQAIDKREAKQDPTIRKLWDDLKKAAKEDPGRFGAQFANALIADPELLFAPMGLGTKVVATTRVAAGATAGGRVTRIADKIIDAGSVEAALNVGIEAAQASSEGVEYTSAQARQSATIGAVAGGILGPIFSRGAVAKDAVQRGKGKIDAETFEQHLRDIAAEDLEVEAIVDGTSTAPVDVKTRIEQALGIVNRTPAERKAFLAARGKELRKTFTDEADLLKYQQFKAEERMLRSQQYAEERAAAEASRVSAAEQASTASAARSETFDAEFDAAIAARADAEAVGMEVEARALNEQIDKFHKAETDAIMEDLLVDTPAAVKGLRKAAARDRQRGEVDPNLLARTAVVATGVAAGVALMPEEQKMSGGFLGGLAGLVIPGGGRVLSRMRQSGAISPDGDIVSRLIREKKLKPDVDMEAQKAAEAEVIERAKTGDQLAYKTLYEDNYPRMERMAQKLLREAGPKLGIDAADIAQDAFIKAFQNLDKFDGRAQFSTWIHSIVRNEGLQAIRKATAEKHGGALQFVSQDMPGLKDAGGEFANRTLMDEGLGADMNETPETIAMRQEVEGQLIKAFERLPDDVREALRLTQIELLTDVEAAAAMGRPLATVQSWVARGKKEVTDFIAKDVGAKPDAVEAPRRGRGRPPGSKNKDIETLTIYRGRAQSGEFDFDTGGFPSEGTGLYGTTSREGAASFGPVETYQIPKPKNPLIAHNKKDPLPLLDSNENMVAMEKLLKTPIAPTDSPWIKINKEAYQEVLKGWPSARLDEAGFEIGKKLTEIAKRYGYDAVQVKPAKGPDWYVFFDGHEKYKPIKSPGNKQAGYADPNHLKAITGAGALAAVAAWAVDVDMDKPEEDRNSRMTAAMVGAGAGLLLFANGGRGVKSLGENIDALAGASSTRILNKSKAIHKRILTTERRLIGETHRYIETTGDFLRSLKGLDKTTSGVLTRALMTGNAKVITRVLDAIGDPKLTAGYKAVRSTLDSLGDQLVAMKRFSKGNFEYFPRIITDLEGLFAHIGKEETATIKGALEAANIESLRKNGRPISQLEEAAIVNQKLFTDRTSTQPGWSKDRGIEEITPEMQKFYASPAESLHTYIRSAVQDIERAKFFGTYAQNMKKGKHEYLDVDRSVNNLIAEEIRTGKLSQDDAREIGSILKSRFGMGEHGEMELIRNFKNVANIGLLGNFWSAATQLADIGITVFTQGLKPTLEAVVRQATNRKLVNMKDFGLVDHISEEFANQLKTTRWVNRFFKLSLFAGVDQVGKNTTLNAAIIKAQGWVKTPQGQLKLANKYQEAFGADFPKLVSDLKGGKVTELTRDYAFMELSRAQPISRIEMPQAYLNHPNLRSYLWLKSFTMKQVDLMRREAYNEIKAGLSTGGDRIRVARGLKNMTNLGIMMGLSGATTSMIKDFMMGNDVEFKASDVYLNMFKNLGWSEYQRDQFAGVTKEEAAARRDAGDERARTRKAEPLGALMSTAVPPFRMFDELVRGDSQKARRFMVPLIGPYLAEQYKKVQDMQEEVESN